MVGDTFVTNTAMVKLAERSGFTVARKHEDVRLMHLVKDLAAHAQRTNAFRPSLQQSSVAT
jgi:hypothetical protein